ncbi:hypothetical protein HD806DRAFT_536156 [Xylariaceae sp. AK1471]|nr:hypothetical protein HD806DRAFT_536156 [Xylariaceae sp. AK1471]
MPNYLHTLEQPQPHQDYRQKVDGAEADKDSGRVSSTAISALDVARDSPQQEPTIVEILNKAMTEIWRRVVAQPNDYVMSRDEFAIFNFFQDRYRGNRVAKAARARYWDYGILTDPE